IDSNGKTLFSEYRNILIEIVINTFNHCFSDLNTNLLRLQTTTAETRHNPFIEQRFIKLPGRDINMQMEIFPQLRLCPELRKFVHSGLNDPVPYLINKTDIFCNRNKFQWRNITPFLRHPTAECFCPKDLLAAN